MASAMSLIFSILVGFLSGSYFAWRLTEIAAVNDHIEDLKEIERLAASYWLGENPETKDVLAHKLRGKLYASSVFRAKFSSVIGKQLAAYTELEGQLFDTATGGTFQTISFEPDAGTAVSVMRICNELRALLRTVRRQVYWAH
jgi:hypothetical protein